MKNQLLTIAALAALLVSTQTLASANTVQAAQASKNFGAHIEISLELPKIQIEQSVKSQAVQNLQVKGSKSTFTSMTNTSTPLSAAAE